MKTLSLTAPDEVFDKAVEALCEKGNWAQTGDLDLGDEGKVDFAKGILLDWLGELIGAMETRKAQEAIHAQQAAIAEQIRLANIAAREVVALRVE